MSSRVVVIEPSAPWVLVTLTTRCAPGGPTGITIRPPALSCCRSGGGTGAMPQGAMVLSEGGGPSPPSAPAAGLELLQGRRRRVVGAAGDDDLVEGRGLFPAVVAVGRLALDVLELGVALLDQLVVETAGARRQGRDDLDRVGVLGQVGDVGRLHARPGADLQHLLAALDVDDVGH